jgi:hypothetical protein
MVLGKEVPLQTTTVGIAVPRSASNRPAKYR